MIKKVNKLQTLSQADLTTLDEHEFGQVVEPHRRELLAHCYRMLGSVHDAEDTVQETLLRAWRRRESYEGRASFRAWLYKIATNLCLDALDQRPRRMIPITRQGVSSPDEPIPASIMEPIWLEPFPDDLLASDDDNPEIYLSTRENITVAFMAALHLLPPRQRAVLILRDVLEWQASEVASLLDLSVSAVKSALHRARTTLATRYPAGSTEAISPHVLDESTQTQLEQYVSAWETADIDGLLALLKEEATFSMPPIPSWYSGRDNIGKLVSKTIFSGKANGRWRLAPTRANGQIAFGLYQRDPENQVYSAYGIQVLTMTNGQIADILTFRKPSLVAYFKLPMTLRI
ncbi:MAG: sigma-70 family RNA polymerase sigma factor [Chloroflexota bacterium]